MECSWSDFVVKTSRPDGVHDLVHKVRHSKFLCQVVHFDSSIDGQPRLFDAVDVGFLGDGIDLASVQSIEDELECLRAVMWHVVTVQLAMLEHVREGF